jgi:hypothetical protein
VLLAIVPGTLTLNGCVAGLALSAAEMAAQAAQGTPTSNAGLKPQATAQCTAQAAHYGTPHIIDVQQASISKIIVWGTVDDGEKRLSFECAYGTKIKSFKLRPINPLPGLPTPQS